MPTLWSYESPQKTQQMKPKTMKLLLKYSTYEVDKLHFIDRTTLGTHSRASKETDRRPYSVLPAACCSFSDET